MTKKWADVAAQPAFQSLSLEEQEEARRQYFESVVAPRVESADIDSVREQFLVDTRAATVPAAAQAAEPAPERAATRSFVDTPGGAATGLVAPRRQTDTPLMSQYAARPSAEQIPVPRVSTPRIQETTRTSGSPQLTQWYEPAPATLWPQENDAAAPKAPSRGVDELRPYTPTLFQRFAEFVSSPNRDRAAVELAARQIAERENIPLDEVYRLAGGARSLFNPEGRNPVVASAEAAQIVSQEIPKIPAATANTVLRVIQGNDVGAFSRNSLMDRLIRATDGEENANADPNYEPFNNLGKSFGYSLTTLVSSAVVGAGATALTGPVGGMAAAAAASTAVAYRASKNEFLERVRDNLDKESKKVFQRALSADEWASARQQFESAAVKYGAWEAIPETVSNLIFLRAFGAPLKAAGSSKIQEYATRAIRSVATGYVPENITETITALGQNAAEIEAGLETNSVTLQDAFKQQFIPTLFLTGGTASAAAAVKKGSQLYEENLEPIVSPARALARAVDSARFQPADTEARARLDPQNYDPRLISPAETTRSATTNFTPADSPTRAAGLPDIVVPFQAGAPNVGGTDLSGTLAAAGGQSAGLINGAGLGVSGLADVDAGGLSAGPAAGMATLDTPPATAADAALQPTSGLKSGPLARASDADLLSRAMQSQPENNNADTARPVTVWTGRSGDGYGTLEAAQAGLQSRLKREPTLRWEVEQMPSGKYQLAGYAAPQAGQAAPSATPQATVSPLASSGSAPILSPNGRPFSTPQTASVFAQQSGMMGFTPVKVDGGWGIQPAESNRATQAPQAQQAAAQGQQVQGAAPASARQPDADLSLPQRALPDAVFAELSRNPRSADIRGRFQAYLDGLVSSGRMPAAPQLGTPDAEAERTINVLGNLFGAATGIDNRVVAYSEPGAENGFAVRGIAFVNTAFDGNSIDAPRTAWHELRHVAEQLGRAGNKPAQQFTAEMDTIFDGMTEEGKRAYVENFWKKEELDAIADPAAREARLQEILQSTGLRSEMVADFLGNRSQDRAFLIDLAKADPKGFEGFVKKWLAVIDNLIAKLRGSPTQGRKESALVDSYVRDLNTAKMVARDALIAFRRGNLEAQGQADQMDDADGGAPARSIRQRDFSDPEERLTVSTAQPTAKPDRKTGYQPDSYSEKRVIDAADIKDSKGHVATIVNALRSYNTLTGKGDAKKVMQELHDVVVENLLWLHDHVKPEARERAKLWYDGANRIANDWASKFDLNSRQTGGVLAVFSPQMDWFKNVSLAERALVILTRHSDETWSKGMADWAESWLNASPDVGTKASRSADLVNMRRIADSGKPLKDMSNEDAAYFIRAFDEAYFSRNYRLVTPEGGFDGFVVNDDGETLASVTWGGFGTIEKAVSIFRDGSFRNVDQQLGGEHKVRNFYNNIVDPNSADGHVTIDTHAVAAAFVKPLSGTSTEVTHNLGGLGSNAATGASGSYALYADAYRDAAARRGLLAREMQSITWEAVRALFPAETKSGLSERIGKVWDRVKAGEVTRDEARKEIVKIAGGVRAFAWEGGGTGSFAADGATSFDTAVAQDPDAREVRTLEPKTAKDKMQVSLSAATNTIPGIRKLYQLAQGKDIAAHALLQEIALDSLKHLLSGTSATLKMEPATGLYGGASEPSLSLTATFADEERATVLAALEKFAQNFNQEQVHVRQGTKSRVGTQFDDGSYATPVYRWELKKALDRKQIQGVIDKSGLYGLTFGETFVEAYYVGDVSNEESVKQFYENAGRADRLLGAARSSLSRQVARLWPYGVGDGAIGYERIRGDISPREAVTSKTAKRVAEYLKGSKVKVFDQAPEITDKQAALQREIAAVYESLPDNDLKNPRVRKAYDELAKEVVRQFNALPVKVEVMTGQGEPYSSSAAMRRDILDNNHLFIFGTTPEAFGPEGADFTGHPLLEDSGLKDQNGYPLLANDLLRAVHDYYAHAMAPVQFGPKGEEAAWKNHMSMTNSPWARWALTAETRGQNSWVNFRPLAQGTLVTDRPFARQKAALMPIEHSMTGDRNVDAVMRELEQKLPAVARRGSKPVKDMADMPAFSPRQRTPLGFYSALSDGVQQMKASALPVVGWKDAIKGMLNKGQIKQEEVEWTGLNDWLDLQQGKVTKAQVQEYLNANGVQVEETVLGDPNKQTEADTLRTRLDALGYDVDQSYDGLGSITYRADDAEFFYDSVFNRFEDSDGNVLPDNVAPLALRLVELAGNEGDEAIAGRVPGGTRYSNYTLPGGTNYREVALTLPGPEKYRAPSSHSMGEKADVNRIAHVRMNDRTDADGKRVLFVEELQSDWGQEGRDKGFVDPVRNRQREVLLNERTAIEKAGGLFGGNSNVDANRARVSEINAELIRLGVDRFDAKPPAPFVTKTEGWLNLSLKRVIAMAAEGGYDKIAFINGQQSADRYSLSQQVRALTWRRTDNDQFEISGEALDGGDVEFGTYSAAKLPDVVGKEIAEKILTAAKPSETNAPDLALLASEDIAPMPDMPGAFSTPEGVLTPDEFLDNGLNLPQAVVDAATRIAGNDAGTLSGLDLKVGGEGMRAFYDKIVPAAVNKLLPKLGGGRMGSVTIDTGGRADARVGAPDEAWPFIIRVDGREVNRVGTREVAEMEVADLQAAGKDATFEQVLDTTITQPGFDVTPAMREKVEEGLPMFSPKQTKQRNAIQLDKDGLVVENPRLSDVDRSLKIEPKTLLRLFESATDKLRRSGSPALKELATRVDRYFDQVEARVGKFNGRVRPAMNAIAKDDMKVFEQYWRDFDNGRRADADKLMAANPKVLRLVRAVKDSFTEAGQENQRVGVRVFDAKTGEWRLIGRVGEFWPRVIREEVAGELESGGTTNPELWNEMLDALVDGDYVQSKEEAGRFIRNYFASETSTDYFAGIEKARGEKLPEMFYDYSWDVAAGYAYKWAQRVSQIESFGQVTGPGTVDFFDKVKAKVIDRSTADYITAVQQRVYDVRQNTVSNNLMANLNMFATGTQLGNPATAVLNILGGSQLNVQMFGYGKMLKGYIDLARDFEAIMQEGTELGILGKDTMMILKDNDVRSSGYLSDSDRLAKGLRGFTSFTMRWGGYNGTEQLIRANAFLAAKAQLSEALQAWRDSPESTTARKYNAFMTRNRIDKDALIKEGGVGEETAKYLRLMVNIPQGSYRIDQTPVYVDTPVGRFFFKYQKFGTQVSRLYWEQNLKPLLDAISGKSEESVLTAVARNLRWFSAAMLGGSAVLAARAALFGMQDPGPDDEELEKALRSDDNGFKMLLLFERAWASLMAGSAFGFFGNYAQMVRDISDRQRVKDPLSPPGLAPILTVKEALLRLYEQGKLTPRDIDDLATQSLALYRSNKRLAASASNALGLEIREFQLEQARRDVAYVRKVAKWFAKDSNLEGRVTTGGRFGLSANSASNRKIYEAVILGDLDLAVTLATEEYDRIQASDDGRKEWRRRRQSILSSLQSRHPSNISQINNREDRDMFLEWAQEKLPEAKRKKVVDMVDNYEDNLRSLRSQMPK